MSERTMASARVLILSVFVLGIAVAYEAYSNFAPTVGSVVMPSIAKEYEGHCAITHTTVLVRIFGDALCPVLIPGPAPAAP